MLKTFLCDFATDSEANKDVWAEFSTLGLAVLLCVQLHGLYKYGLF